MCLGVVALVGFGIHPDGKELRAQIAGASFVEADVADVFRVGVADVEVFVEKALRRVGMSVHDDGRFVDGACLGAEGGRFWAEQSEADDESKSASRENRRGFMWIGKARILYGREMEKSKRKQQIRWMPEARRPTRFG